MAEHDALAALRVENTRLVALLESHGTEWRTPTSHLSDAEQPEPPRSSLSTVDKVALFRRLFRGRTDVYPVRWEGKTSGKSGYAPACADEWQAGVCEKPRNNGSDLRIGCGTPAPWAHQQFSPKNHRTCCRIPSLKFIRPCSRSLPMPTTQSHSQPQPQANSQPNPVADLSLPPFLRMAMVIRMTGLGRTTIYRLMAANKFPCPVRLAKRAVGWRRSDLEQWSQARPTVAH